jgi:iron complex outermembrane recepter protein
MTCFRPVLMGSVAAFGAACAFSSFARADDTETLAEVVVTAQKRVESVQKVPLAVTAISGDLLNENQVKDVGALAQLVPNVVFNDAVGETRIGIRGITFDNIAATGGEARVAYNLDGIYLSRTENIPGSFFDVDRVEVLRGPQGTLFGRNAIAGAVNVFTRDPTATFTGYLQGNVGNYDATTLEAALGGPITDTVSFRVAGRSSDHNGYGENLTTGQSLDNLHRRDVRGKLKFQPNDALRIVLSADYTSKNDNQGLYFGGYLFPGTSLVTNPLVSPPGNLRDSYSNATTKTYLQFFGFGANADWDLGDGLSLTSLSSYRHGHSSFVNDYDFTSLQGLDPGIEGDLTQQLSQELRLQKDFSRGHLLVGAYYFYENYKAGSHVPINVVLFGGPDFVTRGVEFGGRQYTRAVAGFSQGTFDATDSLHLTLGVRYSRDQKSVNEYNATFLAEPYNPAAQCRQPCNQLTDLPSTAFLSGDRTWSNVSPRASIQYDFDSSRNIYFTFSKGFKSGGFNVGLDTFGNGFNPETLNNYEIGFKGDFLERRLRTNVASFYYDYKNLQVFQDLNQQIGAIITNAAAARLYGFEAEIEAIPVERLRVNLAFSVMKSEFTDFLTGDPSRPNGPNGNQPNYIFDLAGNRLPSAPTYTASYGVQYTWPTNIGGITLRGEANSTSKVYFDQYNVDPMSAAAVTIANAFVNYESNDHKYYGSLYIRNLSDEFRIAGATLSNGFSNMAVQTSFIPPRTFGVAFGARL